MGSVLSKCCCCSFIQQILIEWFLGSSKHCKNNSDQKTKVLDLVDLLLLMRGTNDKEVSNLMSRVMNKNEAG